jgi:hypothetical protein
MNSPLSKVGTGKPVIFNYNSFVVESATNGGPIPNFKSITDEKTPNKKYGLR